MRVAPIFVNGSIAEQIFDADVANGCPSYAIKNPTPNTTPCPTWFATPERGKGTFLVENFFSGFVSTIKAAAGMNFQARLPEMQLDMPGRLLLQLVPGHYEFEINALRTNSVAFDISAGQQLVLPIGIFNLNSPWLVSGLQSPPNCP